jgi:hypothetical protein
VPAFIRPEKDFYSGYETGKKMVLDRISAT